VSDYAADLEVFRSYVDSRFGDFRVRFTHESGESIDVDCVPERQVEGLRALDGSHTPPAQVRASVLRALDAYLRRLLRGGTITADERQDSIEDVAIWWLLEHRASRGEQHLVRRTSPFHGLVPKGQRGFFVRYVVPERQTFLMEMVPDALEKFVRDEVEHGRIVCDRDFVEHCADKLFRGERLEDAEDRCLLQEISLWWLEEYRNKRGCHHLAIGDSRTPASRAVRRAWGLKSRR
jgi:hypothetical protein